MIGGLLLVLAALVALAGGGIWLWGRIDVWLFGQWTESYETVARKERTSMFDWLFGAREPEEGTVRALPEPQPVADADPPTATHAIYQGGRWVPAAGEAYADGRTDIIPVLQYAEEDA